MSTLSVTSEGQITLSNELLKHLGVRAGNEIAVRMLPGGVVEMRAAGQTGQISDVFGLFKNKTRRALSIDEINNVAVTPDQGFRKK